MLANDVHIVQRHCSCKWEEKKKNYYYNIWPVEKQNGHNKYEPCKIQHHGNMVWNKDEFPTNRKPPIAKSVYV